MTTFDLEALTARDKELAGRPMPPPRYATTRPDCLRSRLDAVVAASELYGRPLIPWQRHAADLATCLNPPGAHFLWRYQVVIIVVPRQAGKTELAQALLTERAFSRANHEIRVTAQSGKYASALWRRFIDPLENYPAIWDTMRVGRSGGNERAIFASGSVIAPFPPKRDALHSQTISTVLVDEAWAHSKASAAELIAAVRPAQITRRDRQLIIISAMGDDRSDWLEEQIDLGRASISDPNSTTLYLEWSPDPELDLYDPATWEYHPALGHLITLVDLAGETADHTNFVRSYMNRSIRDQSGPVDLTVWDELTEEAPTGTFNIAAFDVSIDGNAASVWTCRTDQDDTQHLAMIDTRAGTDWLPPLLDQLHQAGVTLHAPATHGQVRSVIDGLTRAKIPVTTWTAADESLAWANLTRRIKARTIRHTGSLTLREALKVVRLPPRTVNPAPDRRQSLGLIDSIGAAQLAAHASARPRTPLQLWM